MIEDYKMKCAHCKKVNTRTGDFRYGDEGYKYTYCDKCKKVFSFFVRIAPVVTNVSKDVSMFEKKVKTP